MPDALSIKPTKWWRVATIVGAAVYVVAFTLSYVFWVGPLFRYLGMAPRAVEIFYSVAAALLGIIPALWLPVAFTRASQFAYWVIYLIVYVPSTTLPIYLSYLSISEALQLAVVIFAGFSIIGMCYLLPLIPLELFRLRPSIFWILFSITYVALNVWVISVFAGHMRLVSFADVYTELRDPAAELMRNSNVGYATMWLARILNPLILCWGLRYGNRSCIVLSILDQLMLFTTAGDKFVVLSPALALITYWIVRTRNNNIGAKIVWGAAASICFLLALYLVQPKNSIIVMAVSVVLMRGIIIPGFLTALYSDFFDNHPFTFYSHVHGINQLITYPYPEELGKVLGFYYFKPSTVNLNAHFWATDGIAAAGLFGIIAVSIVCCLLFWAIDSATGEHDIAFASAYVSFSAATLANVSIFTTLVSGGLMFSILVLWVMPLRPRKATSDKRMVTLSVLNRNY